MEGPAGTPFWGRGVRAPGLRTAGRALGRGEGTSGAGRAGPVKGPQGPGPLLGSSACSKCAQAARGLLGVVALSAPLRSVATGIWREGQRGQHGPGAMASGPQQSPGPAWVVAV